MMKHGFWFVCAALQVLGGCALQPQLARVAVDHNALVAKTEDELTLLNIVRAKERFPMHFTTLTVLRGNATLTAGAEASLALPEMGGETAFDAMGKAVSSKDTVAVTTVTPKLSGSVSTNPSFEAGVLNTEKFQRGIQQPIKTEILEYFLQQGWPDDLLMALMFERIDAVAAADGDGYAKGDLLAVLTNANYRGDPVQDASAKIWLAFIQEKRLVPRQKTKAAVDLVPLAPILANSRIQDLATLDGKSFDIGTTNGVSMVQRPETQSVAIGFADRVSPAAEAGSTGTKSSYQFTTSKSVTWKVQAKPDVEKAIAGDKQIEGVAAVINIAGKDIKATLKPVMRSVQGIMYFLGEYSRGGEQSDDTRYILPSVRLLFDLVEGDSLADGKTAIATRFRNKRYSIPDDTVDGGISLQVIDIVQQLLNLHKSADDLLLSRSVTVVQ